MGGVSVRGVDRALLAVRNPPRPHWAVGQLKQRRRHRLWVGDTAALTIDVEAERDSVLPGG